MLQWPTAPQQEETPCLRDAKQQQQKLLKGFEYLLAVQTQEVLGHEAEEERVDIVQTPHLGARAARVGDSDFSDVFDSSTPQGWKTSSRWPRTFTRGTPRRAS